MTKYLKFSALALAFVLAQSQSLPARNYAEVVAEGVLMRLFQTAGQQRFAQPTLTISKENGKVAAYFPGKNKIVLDEKAYLVCRSFGRDSLSALALLLSHELTHAFQTEMKKTKASTNFLAYDRYISADVRLEKVADVQGTFNAWLAGYRVQGLTADLFQKIYEAYGLVGKNLPGYPSLDERKAAAREVMDIVETLIDLHEGAGYLFATGYFEMAGAAWEYILRYYQGREVYNNLGVACVRHALEFHVSTTDRYVYPLELDWSSGLRKSRQSRGEVVVGSAEYLLRQQLLVKAAGYFNQALQLDPKYPSARLNTACVMNLQGRHADALSWLNTFFPEKKAAKKTDPVTARRAAMLRGVTQGLLGNSASARVIFKGFAADADPMLALQAEFNLRALDNLPPETGAVSDFAFPPLFVGQMAGVEMPGMADVPHTALESLSGAYFARKAASGGATVFSFGYVDGPLVSFVRKKNTLAPTVRLLDRDIELTREGFSNVTQSPTGYFFVSEKDRIMVKTDVSGRVQELVRQFVH